MRWQAHLEDKKNFRIFMEMVNIWLSTKVVLETVDIHSCCRGKNFVT